MNVKDLVQELVKNGVPVISHHEWPDGSGGEIKIHKRFAIQVEGGEYCLTYEDGNDTLAAEPLRSTTEQIVADAKKYTRTN